MSSRRAFITQSEPLEAPLIGLPLGGRRIAVCDYSGHPFQVQLSRELARRGHDVHHLYFSEFQTPHGCLRRLESDAPTFSIEAVSLGRPFSKNNLVRRRAEEIEIGGRIATSIGEFAPDVVIACNLPLDALAQVVARAKRGEWRLIFWQQDIYSIAIEKILSKRYGPAGVIAGKHYRHLEKIALEASNKIIAISPDFVRTLKREFDVPDSKIEVIENWAPLDEIRPRAKDNPWSRRHGLADREVVLYTGTLGMKHDPALLLALARTLGERQNAILVVTSEGTGAEWLRKQGRDLASLRVLPFQSYEVYSDVLASADVLVAILEEDAGAFSVPSKILSYLCSARPIVLSAPTANLASRTVRKARAGEAIPSGWRDEFAGAAISLLDNADRRRGYGAAARTYAEKHFEIGDIGDRFCRLVDAYPEQPLPRVASIAVEAIRPT